MSQCAEIKIKTEQLYALRGEFEIERRKPSKLRNRGKIKELEIKLTDSTKDLAKFSIELNIERIADALGVDRKNFTFNVDADGFVSFKTFLSVLSPRMILNDRRSIVKKIFFTDESSSDDNWFKISPLSGIIRSKANKITSLRLFIGNTSINELEPLELAVNDKNCKLTELEVVGIQNLGDIYRLERLLASCNIPRIILKTSGSFLRYVGVRDEKIKGLKNLIDGGMQPTELIIKSHDDVPDKIKAQLQSLCDSHNITFKFELL